MRRIVFALAGVVAVAAIVGYISPVYGEAPPDTAPSFLKEIPPGYREFGLISVGHLTAGKLSQLRSQIGNDIAIKAYREGKLPFPDGSIVAAIHWNEQASEENTSALASLRIGGVALQSSVAGAVENIQFMVKDSKKYAATGGWGFGDFKDGKPRRSGADEDMLRLPPACERSRSRFCPLRTFKLRTTADWSVS
jgi:hypothetical protein